MNQQEQARSDLSVEALGEALELSASGYYAWCEGDISSRQQADVRLGDEIEWVFIESRRTYGSHRVWLGLCERGIRTVTLWAKLYQAFSPKAVQRFSPKLYQ